jgi:16S rRNA (cytosine967-C5)-methyltransferase
MGDVRASVLVSLSAVLGGGAKPKEEVERHAGGFTRRDTALLTELLYGVVRHRDTLDWTLAKFLARPGRIGARTRHNLRLGVYQILFTRVPEWAAVNEAVSLERKHSPLVNAVLRKVARGKKDILAEQETMERTISKGTLTEREIVSSVCALTSHPPWLIRRWVRRFGPEEALALARANNEIPPLVLRVNTLQDTRDEVIGLLGASGVEAEPTRLSPQGVRLRGRHRFAELEGLVAGLVAQDEAAQVVSLLLDPRPGERVLDACAAPGGKTTHMAQLMADEGEVVAVDMDEKRLSTLRENVGRLGLRSVRALQGDVTALAGLGSFDRVLVDAPCSATGVIRRNPDVKYRHRERDLAGFRERQLGILMGVSGTVRRGGVLLFATCSTEPEEGEDVAGEFLRRAPDFIMIEDAPLADDVFREGVFRSYPHRHGMDGFFAVRFKRQT